MKYSLVAALVAASVALAEPVDPNTIDPCLKNCAETAATAGSVGCSSIFDTACVCGKKDAFVAAATPCVLSGCADKAAEAISMVSTLCTEGIKGGGDQQSSAAPEPTSSEETKPEPSSEAPPAPSSDAGEQSSEAPAPTSSAGETKPSAGGEGETIEGLSPCASKCMVEGAAKQGCKGQDDTACICTDAFKTAVTPCVAACGADDVTAALALSAKKCAAPTSGEAKPSASASGSGGATKPTSGGEAECDPRGGSGACAKKYTEAGTLTKSEDKPAETSQAAAAGAEADAAKQGSGAKALTTGAALTIAGVIAAALF
ncbi:hypothetical protein A1Q1_04831 [Trichosporon asahii var. asahii CBS 2479]|uniref:CFEM domain-containing protein n=1 Tax=Trichosporon asahii var. asahii (strain ATCC 90039 / CBS 2479 / JCM 2466 / KCTC 7840 / NBRC 103889/ NCYC 2677 / UAMH 7654) TaxID=1186058 RepID=J5SN19_TRIAS|nr:hypothetical protein A1Q1_04831 [Trichosporon asahii var. asahii CBS 2479]EJT46536.1 hypothetical protein A1Q1_04831 [Trichosporon asahii var. asahii CBS 2479]